MFSGAGDDDGTGACPGSQGPKPSPSRGKKTPAPAVQTRHPVSRAATLAAFLLNVRCPGCKENMTRPRQKMRQEFCPFLFNAIPVGRP